MIAHNTNSKVPDRDGEDMEILAFLNGRRSVRYCSHEDSGNHSQHGTMLQKRNTDRVEEDSNEEIDNDDSGDDKELYGCDIDDDVSVTDSFLEALKLDLPLDDLVQLSYDDHMKKSIKPVTQKSKFEKESTKKTIKKNVEVIKKKAVNNNKQANKLSNGKYSGERAEKQMVSNNENLNLKSSVDTLDLEIEADARVKAMKLRLSGQLRTIKTLQKQLSETTSALEGRNKQLAQACAKIRSLQTTKPKENVPINKPETSENYLKEKPPVALEKLQIKLEEEQSRRHRSEDRLKNLKDLTEKMKHRSAELEAKNKELLLSTEEMKKQSDRYRKQYKDTAADVSVLKLAVVEKDNRLAEEIRKNESLELTLRHYRMEIEHSREELSNQQQETQAYMSKAKQLTLQLEIEHEKEMTRKAEMRLVGLHTLSSHTSGHTIPSDNRRSQSGGSVRRKSSTDTMYGRSLSGFKEQKATDDAYKEESNRKLVHDAEKKLNDTIMRNSLAYVHSYQDMKDRAAAVSTSRKQAPLDLSQYDETDSNTSMKPESLPTEEDSFDNAHKRKISEKQNTNSHMIGNVNKSSGAVDTVRSLMDKSGLHNTDIRIQNHSDNNNSSDISTAPSSSTSYSMYVLDTTTTSSNLNSSTLSGPTSDAKGKFSRLQKLYEKIVSK